MEKLDQKKLGRLYDKIYKKIRKEMLKKGYTNKEIDQLIKDLG